MMRQLRQLLTSATQLFISSIYLQSLESLRLNSHPALPVTTSVWLLLPVLAAAPSPGFAATNVASSGFWDYVLLLVVMAAVAGSAALPISAYRHWTGYWKLVAAIPLLFLAGWSSWILVAWIVQPTSHPYWLLEIFAWAMLAMLYMATMMTAKRQFEKADNPDSE